ncbi:glycosyltransferase family 2 protein [Campylobacter lari]|uniref:glycosyltransferase family 2 protein n=1 Tax=Campylobacter lari TaxID=201 RepID=UPI0021F78B62|nr:glycosyltransferase [Campylobacter lari]EHH0538162.1 glycosyltransferase family 2 protein [Campylobacter lari]MCW0188854.1 glycosyltransferase [Campylobacter lari]
MLKYKNQFLENFQQEKYFECKKILSKYLCSMENLIFLEDFCRNFSFFDNFERNEIYEIAYLYLAEKTGKEDKILLDKYYKIVHFKLNNNLYNKKQIDIADEILNSFEILIPTYNRKNIILETIKDIKHVNSLIHITVIDNFSEDGTFEALKILSQEYPNINIFQNSYNIGFSRNIFECIKKSSKKYIFLISDEDPVIVQDFIETIDYIKNHAIDWLIPINFRIKDGVILKDRGSSVMKKITPDLYRHVAQYSGVLYNGDFLKQNLDILEKYITDRGAMYHYLLYSVLSCISQNGLFWPKPLVYPKNLGMRYIEKELKDNIYFVAERWYQFRMIVKFTEDMEQKVVSGNEKQRLLELRSSIFKTIFTMLYASATKEYAKYSKLFDGPIQVRSFSDKTIQEKDTIINNTSTELKQVKLSIQNTNKILHHTQHLLSFQIKYGLAKQRIQNQLSYKLGQAMIINSKSLLGYIKMPFVLSYIKDKHNQEQKIYQEKIKKDPSLILPPLKNYPDYKEALKEKQCLTYKLGQALIQANKEWYKGGYIKLWFKVKKLKKEFKKGIK